MVTASYISPDLAALQTEVLANNLTFLNEVGLDPGIDHIVTKHTVDTAAREGAKVYHYESWCGGIPSPDNCDNALGYKFSWSPAGALNALQNQAIYLENGLVFSLPPESHTP